MHSSIFNKIRILKPRKKSGVQSNIIATKSFTINNDNCHASLVLKDSASNDKMPPLEPPPTEETDKPVSKWVPFYVVNVPKINFDNTKSDACNSNSETDNNELSGSSQHITNTHAQITENDASKSQLDSPEDNWTSAQNIEENVAGTQRSTRSRNAKGNHSVSCFLCPTTFDSVKDMQEHYLENHKHKKRTANNSGTKTVAKKVNKSAKPKDPLKITEEDTSSGDGEPKCPICSIYFKTKDEVKNHMTSVHCYKCSECDNTFYTLFQFTDHRCSKYIVKKRPKLKRKKPKSGTVQDPLALELPPRRFINILPKNAHNIPTSSSSSLSSTTTTTTTTSSSSYPLILNYPVQDQMEFSQAHISSTQSSASTAASNLGDIRALNNQMLLGNNNNNNHNNNNNKTVYKNSLLNCSLEELTSKEFNKMKLDEIIKNPHLSVNWIPKKNPESTENYEFFSCGRCNVLCEDNIDYVEHLEECLRLSNVSLLESSTSERLLKLKSEIVPQKNSSTMKTTINRMLLKELRSIIGPEKSDLFDFKYEEEEKEDLDSKVESTALNACKSDFVHPDIKGNISITRIKPVEDHFDLNLKSNQFHDPKRLPVQIIHSMPYHASTSNTLGAGIKQSSLAQQPMVIIPLSHSGKDSQILTKQRELDNPDYPNISITDKSNSVTWNFIGSESGAILRVESPFQTSSCLDMSRTPVGLISHDQNKIVQVPMASLMALKNANLLTPITSTSSKSPENVQEPELTTMKIEPLSPTNQYNSEEMDKSPVSSEDFKDNFSSMELVLDEEEIKMEVEEEIVDDQF